MTKKLKRIAPVKFGIVMGVFYGLISLVIVPFFLIAIIAASFAPNSQNSMSPGLSIGMGVAFAIFLPFFYAIFGCLFGMLAAWMYNVVASWIGGIEFEVE
jgi:hypothetical protein